MARLLVALAKIHSDNVVHGCDIGHVSENVNAQKYDIPQTSVLSP